MHEIDAHTLTVLEFPRVREIISGATLSPYGRARVKTIRPMHDRTAIERALRESAQMRDIIRFEEAMPLERIEDISQAVEKSRIEGIHLESKDLLTIKRILDIAIALHRYAKPTERKENFPDIIEILSRFHPKYEISKAIGKAIEPTGDIADGASSALTRIRREMSDAEAKLKSHLERILGARRKHVGWQDDVITMRDGRFVIPFLSGDFRSDSGIVHDKSQSGATLYVEPNSAIPLNNRLRQTQQDERLEIDRILRELTAMVGDAANDIIADLDTFGYLDCIHAKATFAIKINGASPRIDQASNLNLIDARHPLLIYASGSSDGVVGLDIALDDASQGILVTGPNTGGKTVALKTIGLLTVMAMSGLEISADHKSTVGMYHKIYADIGDEQSLELSLSTFSSHIRNIIAAINDSDSDSLVLFDEIGAGTDPKEGAALAEVIILTLLDRGCKLIATTHYSQLKTLPLEHPELLNASLEFDRENLRPTYRLKLGHPGSSYAIEIARRLGLPDDLADRAAAILGSDERSLDKLLEKLDSDLDHLQTRKRELENRLADLSNREEQIKSRQDKVSEKEDEISNKYAAQLEKQLEDARQEINRLVKGIRESQASRETIKESQQHIEKKSQELQQRKRAKSHRTTDGRILKKGDVVWIEKFGTEGEVVEMIGDKKVKVVVGSAFMTIETIELTRKKSLSPPTGKSRKAMNGAVRASAAEGDFNPELMLRGMTVEEALEAVDKFLDDAIIAGIGQVYIIHGKGTGTLRKSLSQYLKEHRAIESIRIGDWNEGGHGVTIARLKT